ncbi:MAG TPA: hypothetical protein VF482_12345 [Trebonia sp.]
MSRAEDLLAAAAAEGLPLCALGGVAIQLLCPSAQPGGRWSRTLADLDVATVGKSRARVDQLIRSQDFAADEPFNRMNGSIRLRYFDADETHLDVFVDELRLCHVVDWSKRLRAGMPTLPVPELLLTKLQVVQCESKDLSDLSALLTDQWSGIQHQRDDLERAVRADWGLWRTGQINLEKLARSEDQIVRTRAGELLGQWGRFRLTAKARLRGRVGDRLRWYEEPEEV